MTLKDLSNWVFIPYNYYYDQNHNDLINELRKEGFSPDKLKEGSEYTIDKIIKDIAKSKAKGGKILKDIYNKLEGKINNNSMFLYSGPLKGNKYHRDVFMETLLYIVFIICIIFADTILIK